MSKWYGNQDYIINWENDGEAVKHYNGAIIRNPTFILSQQCRGVLYLQLCLILDIIQLASFRICVVCVAIQMMEISDYIY